jgi:hypothetical protein
MRPQSSCPHNDDVLAVESIERAIPDLTPEQKARVCARLAASALARRKWDKETNRTAATQKARDALAAKRAAAQAAPDAGDDAA